MGTQCEIQFSTSDAAAGRAFVREATSWVGAFEAKYSRFRADSLISRINAAAGHNWIEIDSDAEHMFALADQVHVLTRGVIDTKHLVYYLSFITFGLFLTAKSVDSERWRG